MKSMIDALRTHIHTLTLAAMLLAMGLLLPFLTGQIPQIGSLLSPMHIPVFLCGMTCGPVWGAVVGAVTPLLRSLIFTMPPMAIAPMMAVELAAYGAVSGLLVKLMPGGNLWLYLNLAVSMVVGRILYGAVKMAVLGLSGSEFSPLLILLDTVTDTWVGMIVHMLLIPPLVMLIRRLEKKQA